MAKEVYMPVLGMNQEVGILLRWLKVEGDAVTKGEPLMEIATDKTDVEIEAPATGILRQVRAKDGDEIPVGQVMAVIAGADEDLEPVAAPVPASEVETPGELPLQHRSGEPGLSATPVAARMAAEHGVNLEQLTPSSGSRVSKEDVLAYLEGQEHTTAAAGEHKRIPASPKARRLATEADLDLSHVTSSGPDGAVIARDVEAALSERTTRRTPPAELAVSPRPADDESATLPMTRMWRIMVDRLQESWQSAPHVYLARDIDVTQLVQWYEGLATRSSLTITYTDLLVKIVASALDRHLRLNARWENEQIVHNGQINVGLAVAVAEGLLVPVVHQANRLQLVEIAERRQYLVSGANQGSLAPPDLQGGTFTISNLGMYGIDSFSAIVNPPQAAILAVGRIAERVVAENGQAVVKPMMTVNLSCDHRVVDGARAAEFLRTLAQFCADPLRMLE